MNKKGLVLTGVCFAVGYIGVTKAIGYAKNYIEGYKKGLQECYDNELNAAYGHIEFLEKQIQERDVLLKKSTEQTERLINMINK